MQGKPFPKFNYSIKESLVIEEEAQTIFDILIDFKTWKSWNPWVSHEPDVNLEYSKTSKKEGSFYTWNGEKIGSGKMENLTFNPTTQIIQRLEFIKPFKALSKVVWDLEKTKKGTLVTWTMHGYMPFLLRFMLSKMKKALSSDFKYGLAMLNGKINKKANNIKLTFHKDSTNFDIQKYLSVPFSGKIEDLPKAMEKGYGKLFDYIEKSDFEMCGPALGIYHKMNKKKNTTECDIAVPIKGKGDKGEFEIKKLDIQKYFKTTLQGDYTFLSIAWHQAFSHLRLRRKNKFIWRKPMLEVYATDPRKVKSRNEYLTDLLIPIK